MSQEELLQLGLDDTKKLTLFELRELRQIVLEYLQNYAIEQNIPKYSAVVEIAGRASANGDDGISIAWRQLDKKAPNWLEQSVEDFFTE